MAALARRPCVIATILSGPDLGKRIPPAEADRSRRCFLEHVPAPGSSPSSASTMTWRLPFGKIPGVASFSLRSRPTERPPIDNQSIVC